MTITLKDLSADTKDKKKVKEIYTNSFPVHQQQDVDEMLEKAKAKDTHFYGVYDEEQLCGLTYLREGEDIVYVNYLAVSSDVRSKGYGSKTLDALKEKYAPAAIFLDIETVDSTHEMYELRAKRQAFYFKNGFVETRYRLIEEGEAYDLLCSTEDFSIQQFIDFMNASPYQEEDLHIQPYEE